jgi:hypothetical protein
MTTVRSVLCMLGISFLAACSSEAATPATDSGTAADTGSSAGLEMAIGASGGTVSNADGSGVMIPSGALGATVTITVSSPASAPAPASSAVVGDPLVLGPEGQTFSTPATVSLAFDPERLPSGRTAANVVIMTAAVGSNNYAPLTTTVVDSTHVSAQTSHFSVFVPVVLGGGGGGCTSANECSPGQYCVEGFCTAG